MSTNICILKNMRIGEAKELPDIEIKEPSKKVIGRSTETMIESSIVSREHSEFHNVNKFRDLQLIILLSFRSHD